MAILGYEWIIALVVLIIIIYVIVRIVGGLSRRPAQFPAPATQGPTTIIKEREVIKEIVMVPCRYCGGLMPQASLFCPNCGAKSR
jgi:hypothetical protein